MILLHIFNIHIVTSILSSSQLHPNSIIFILELCPDRLDQSFSLATKMSVCSPSCCGAYQQGRELHLHMTYLGWQTKDGETKCGSSIFILILTVIRCHLCWTKQLSLNSEKCAPECFLKLSFFSQPYREIFEFFIDNFKTYKPLLSAIKNEYEVTLGKLSDFDLWGKYSNGDMFLQSLAVLDTYMG